MTDNCIDQEWEQFLKSVMTSGRECNERANIGGQISSTESEKIPVSDNFNLLIDNPNCLEKYGSFDRPISKSEEISRPSNACEDLYISTTTKVLFLNQSIPIHSIFWQIPVIEYWTASSGVVKKQMKIVSNTVEEFEQYQACIKDISFYREHIIKQINNPAARRIKFKDERKITVGISKKDIMNCRGKVKNAFYNCFAIILRFPHEGVFREIHVKIFNTGKMEIPGILNPGLLDTVKQMILELMVPLVSTDIALDFVENKNEDSVLINSNFNCGFYINRDKLRAILISKKYNIEAAYDSCSYPGVKCKFYFNHEIGFDIAKQRGYLKDEDRGQKMQELGDNKKYTEVSFMIFRTGSCLIVGNCSEPVLRFIYDFIKKMLMEEYPHICTIAEDPVVKNKKPKIRKRQIMMTQEYMTEISRTT